MAHIIAVCGSYRKNGNTDILLKEAMLGAQNAGASTEIIYLSDYNISFCKGCLTCFNEAQGQVGKCCINDDMTNIIVPKIFKCDGLILGTPSYWSNLSGYMKNFIDRMLVFTYNHGGCEPSPRLEKGKKAMLYVVAGVTYRVSSYEGIHYLPLETMKIYLRSANIEVVDYLTASEVEGKGDVLSQPEIMKKALSQGFELAKKLK